VIIAIGLAGALIIAYLASNAKGTVSSVVYPQISPEMEKAGPRIVYPDAKRTPGMTNPDITQMRIQDTICNPAWSTRSIRPTSSYTTRLKRQQMEELGLDGSIRDYEEDHLIPLELGGNPTDPRNLWPESYISPGAREKDRVENYLHKQVCAGTMSLQDAQDAIVSDWYKVYLQLQ